MALSLSSGANPNNTSRRHRSSIINPCIIHLYILEECTGRTFSATGMSLYRLPLRSALVPTTFVCDLFVSAKQSKENCALRIYIQAILVHINDSILNPTHESNAATQRVVGARARYCHTSLTSLGRRRCMFYRKHLRSPWTPSRREADGAPRSRRKTISNASIIHIGRHITRRDGGLGRARLG